MSERFEEETFDQDPVDVAYEPYQPVVQSLMVEDTARKPPFWLIWLLTLHALQRRKLPSNNPATFLNWFAHSFPTCIELSKQRMSLRSMIYMKTL